MTTMLRQPQESERPININTLSIRELPLIVGREPDDVWIENGRVICLFDGAIGDGSGAITRIHIRKV